MATNTYHLQILRGDTAKTQAYTGLDGEFVFNNQAKSLWIHDGVTKGGLPIARISDLPTKVSQLENDANYASAVPGGSSADSAVHDQLGNVINTHYAPINNPTFTGNPKAPTVAKNDNSTNIATTAWVASATSVVHTVGNETINGTKTFTNVINGTALRANWADLAELYLSDRQYEPGTLVQFGGEREVTIATDKVNAVVSEKPAYLMNSSLEDGLPIALVGRVRVKVCGPVCKFDKLVLSDIPGTAMVDNTAENPIAIALEDGDMGLVLCATKFKL